MRDVIALGAISSGDFCQTALLTIIIEVALFALLGYREKKVLAWFALGNFVSNVLFNEFLLDNPHLPLAALLAFGEGAVVALEYCFMLYALPGGGRKLFSSLLLANLASFLAGFF